MPSILGRKYVRLRRRVTASRGNIAARVQGGSYINKFCFGVLVAALLVLVAGCGTQPVANETPVPTGTRTSSVPTVPQELTPTSPSLTAVAPSETALVESTPTKKPQDTTVAAPGETAFVASTPTKRPQDTVVAAPEETAHTTATFRPTSQPAMESTPTITATASAGSPLNGSDVPPAGVAGQLGFSPPTPTPVVPCPSVESGGILKLKKEVTQPLTVCLSGFAPNLPTKISVTQPDGTTLKESVAPHLQPGDAAWYWQIPPDTQYGRHDITATQGALQATIHLDVIPPATRTVAIRPSAGPPGTTFNVFVLGLDPHEPVTLYLYLEEGPFSASYVTSLATLKANDVGTAIYRLETLPDDTPGRAYYIGTGSFTPYDSFYLTER